MAKKKVVRKPVRKSRKVSKASSNGSHKHDWRETWNPDLSKSKVCVECGTSKSIEPE